MEGGNRTDNKHKEMIPQAKAVMVAAKPYLPHGYSKLLIEQLGHEGKKYSKATVSMVLNGKMYNEILFNRIAEDAARYKELIDTYYAKLSPLRQPVSP